MVSTSDYERDNINLHLIDYQLSHTFSTFVHVLCEREREIETPHQLASDRLQNSTVEASWRFLVKNSLESWMTPEVVL